MKNYGVGAAEACRFIAQRTSSQIESDFFQRLSHSLDVGEKLDRFMDNEHDVMMDEYMLKSESALKDLDFVKEIYTGITTSLIFTAVFVAITPILGGKDIDVLLFGVVASFVSMEGFFIYFLKTKVPKDNIWYGLEGQDEKGNAHRQGPHHLHGHPDRRIQYHRIGVLPHTDGHARCPSTPQPSSFRSSSRAS